MEEYELTGTKKQVVKELLSLGKKSFLNFNKETKEGLTNAELSERIGKSKGAVTNATQDLMSKDIIYDAEYFTNGRTDFRVKNDITITKTYNSDAILSASVLLHAVELIIMAAMIVFGISKYFFQNYGFTLSIIIYGLIIIAPRFIYNTFKALQFERDYDLVVKT